jgi:hypothetical protein
MKIKKETTQESTRRHTSAQDNKKTIQHTTTQDKTKAHAKMKIKTRQENTERPSTRDNAIQQKVTQHNTTECNRTHMQHYTTAHNKHSTRQDTVLSKLKSFSACIQQQQRIDKATVDSTTRDKAIEQDTHTLLHNSTQQIQHKT